MHSYISLKQETESQSVASRDKLTVTPVINRIDEKFLGVCQYRYHININRPNKDSKVICTFDQTVFRHWM